MLASALGDRPTDLVLAVDPEGSCEPAPTLLTTSCPDADCPTSVLQILKWSYNSVPEPLSHGPGTLLPFKESIKNTPICAPRRRPSDLGLTVDLEVALKPSSNSL